jgi:hypothetical protein
MKLTDLLTETMVADQPSGDSVISMPLENDLRDMANSITNYAESAERQFLDLIKPKLIGKTVSFGSKTITIKEVEVKQINGEYLVVLTSDDGKKLGYKKGKFAIHNDQAAPTTSLTQNTSAPSDTSQHKIKQF